MIFTFNYLLIYAFFQFITKKRVKVQVIFEMQNYFYNNLPLIFLIYINFIPL